VSRAAGSDVSPRAAGLLLPLFALRSTRDWGIGEIGDLPALAAWMASAGHRLLQLLPILEIPAGERSPYGALTAFAIDPVYLSMDAVEDFVTAGGTAALDPADRALLERARADAAIAYDAVRDLKRRALERAFARFLREWRAGSTRTAELRRFREAEAGWLPDYALFRTLQERRPGRGWQTWEHGLRTCEPAAVADTRAVTAERRLFHEYVQWLAAEQWADARRAAARVGVRLKGDLPFMVSRESADVWARQAEFACEATIGAPPDAFNAAGQDWGLPAHRWAVMAAGDFAWLRARVARAAALFDAVRLDHVVGFYRTFVRVGDRPAVFVPADVDEQRRQGERLLRVVAAAAGATQVIGEDLGSIPEFVRESLTRLAIAGYRVLRWEESGGTFRDPATWPACSVATTGTHDTSALVTWWETELDEGGRLALAAVPGFTPLAGLGPEFTPAVHDALLDGLYGAGSDLVVLPFADAYGGRDRINTPATVGAANWGYRLPWSMAELAGAPGAALRDRLAALAGRHGRV
jgi:4-alpha-glucanotransferase